MAKVLIEVETSDGADGSLQIDLNVPGNFPKKLLLGEEHKPFALIEDWGTNWLRFMNWSLNQWWNEDNPNPYLYIWVAGTIKVFAPEEMVEIKPKSDAA
jgi:hypothetical protein